MRIAPAHDDERSTNRIPIGRTLLSMNPFSVSRGDASPLTDIRSNISDIRPVQMKTPPRNCNAVYCRKTIFDLLALRNDNDDDTFVIHRKLLRRRHVRKEQMRRQREAAKQHRDSLIRKTTTQNATDDTAIRSPVSLSSLGILVSMTSPCNTNSSNTEQSIMRLEPEDIRTIVNGFRATPLPFSPLKAKRRKLDMRP